ncbi:hypothetical protein MRB53_040958 [Persea americana]|nr:hypothetical protein MRB53_040958 [Persea americana]
MPPASRLKGKRAKQKPVLSSALPTELWVLVFSQLNIYDLTRCLEINRDFRSLLLSPPFDFHFFRSRDRVGMAETSTEKYSLRSRGDVARRTITCKDFEVHPILVSVFITDDYKPILPILSTYGHEQAEDYDSQGQCVFRPLHKTGVAKALAFRPAHPEVHIDMFSNGSPKRTIKNPTGVTIEQAIKAVCELRCPDYWGFVKPVWMRRGISKGLRAGKPKLEKCQCCNLHGSSRQSRDAAHDRQIGSRNAQVVLITVFPQLGKGQL